MADRPRWFGRAHGLTTKKRLTEVMYDTCYRGGWASRIARPFGLQGVVRVNATRLLVPARKPAPTLRVAFASDLHSGPCTHPAIVAEACRALSDARPDLLLLGGDYVSFHARHVDRLVPLLKAIEAPLGKFAVLGNHDVVGDDDYITRRLADAGVRMLVNENVQLPAPHADIWICGLDNPEAGAPDADRAFAGAMGTRLVVMHSPDGLKWIGERPYAVAFCGHTHGGQFWFRGRSLLHFKGPLSRRYLKGGLYHLGAGGDRVMLVSRGVGQGSLPMRRGADPEVHLCTLDFAVTRRG